MSAPQQTVVIHESPGTSGVAMAGLVFSILGWFTCGLLCIPGALLSFLGLFSRGPKGAAIAGLIVGFPGVLFFLLIGIGFLGRMLSHGAAATAPAAHRPPSVTTTEVEQPSTPKQMVGAADSPEVSTANEKATASELPPSDATPAEASLPAGPAAELTAPAAPAPVATEATSESDKPAAPEDDGWRTWTSADGKYTVEAKFRGAAAGTVRLEKRDGKIIELKREKLSENDQKWLDAKRR
jgi:hypothetical protein